MKKEIIDKKTLFVAGIIIIFLFQAWWIYTNVVFQLSGGAEWPPREGTRIPETKPVAQQSSIPVAVQTAATPTTPVSSLTPVVLTASPSPGVSSSPGASPLAASGTSNPLNSPAAPAPPKGPPSFPPKPAGGIILQDYLAGIYYMDKDPRLAIDAVQAKKFASILEKLAHNSQTATALENMLISVYNSNQLQYISANFDSLSRDLNLGAQVKDEKEAIIALALKLLYSKIGTLSPEPLPTLKKVSLPAGQRPLTFRDHSAAVLKLEKIPAYAITAEQARKMIAPLNLGLEYGREEPQITSALKAIFTPLQLQYIETKRFEFVKNPPPRVGDMDPLVYAALQTIKKHLK
jgi:hypothetical protein